MDYATAQAFLSGGRNKSSRPIANNTRVERIDADTIGIRLHNTYVVRLHPDGSYDLSSGGWHTMTTADRIRHYKPDDGLNVGGRRIGKGPSRWWIYRGWSNPLTPFFDGIRVKDGEVVNARPQDEVERQAAADLDTSKAIRKYIDAYVEAAKQQIYVDALDSSPEGAIHCWDCSNPTMAGRTTEDGDATAHIRRHVEKREFPPALFYNALRAKGAGPFYFQSFSLGSGDYIVDMTRSDRWMVTQAKRWLRDFLTSQLFERRPFVDYSARRAY